MNAREYVAWARPHLSGPDTRALSLFLALPRRWTRAVSAAAAEHFLESSASSAGFDAVKLALIVRLPPAALAARAWRDAPEKAAAGARLLEELARLGCGYDVAAYERARGLLAAWRLRGSLMISCDFERRASAFGKLTFYGYAPGDGAVAELAGALAAGERPAPEPGGLEFWALDLWPDGRTALKLYRRRPYRRDALPEAARPLGAALESVASVRDLTTLTRVGAAGRPGGGKLYLGLPEGVEPAKLARIPAAPAAGRFLKTLAGLAPGQRVYFVGLSDDGTLEAYFDLRDRDHEEQGPLDDDL